MKKTEVYGQVNFDVGSPENTRRKLQKLQISMTKQQVLHLLGIPYLKETDKQKEIWYYFTGLQVVSKTIVGPDTPLLFIDGKLVGWGLGIGN